MKIFYVEPQTLDFSKSLFKKEYISSWENTT